MKLTNFSVRTRIAVALALIVALLLGVSLLSFLNSSRNGDAIHRALLHKSSSASVERIGLVA